jgi:F-type H+-transporting ATPase subunit b
MTYLAASAGVLDLNGTLIAELIAFIVMVLILARFYPRIAAMAEARQNRIAEALSAAERLRAEAEERLRQAQADLEQARAQASEIISGANRMSDQLVQDGHRRAAETARRTLERAQKDLEGERQQAVERLRSEIADLVVNAAEKVVRGSLDDGRHRKLVEDAIEEVTGNGARRTG